jgi:hypothetical protein
MGSRIDTPRRPDFLLLGAMKAGTTTLFRWLDRHPSVSLPATKEPNVISDDALWIREAPYGALFSGIGTELVTGEASVTYSDPRHAAQVAQRIARAFPETKLLFLTRDPVTRMRSHYIHEVRRGRERRTLLDAITDGDEGYRARSRYLECLEPFIETGANPLLVVPMEGVFGRGHDGWYSILGFLGLPLIAPPGVVANASASKHQFRPSMRMAWDLGIRTPPDWVPTWVRTIAKPLFLSDGAGQQHLIASANEEVPEEISSELEEDYAQLWIALARQGETPPRVR